MARVQPADQPPLPQARLYSSGSGTRTFVLIHGIGVSERYFRPLARELASHATVHRLDLPGFGSAPKPGRAVGIEGHAQAAWRALDELGAGGSGAAAPVLVGHSMGCQVVAEMIRQRPRGAAAAVLMGPTVNPRERSAWRQGLRLLQDTLGEPPRVNAVVLTDYLVRCGVPWYLRNLPALLGYHLEDAMEFLDLPVLILRGDRDPIAPPQWLAELAARCPGAATAELPGQGHILMYRRPADAAAHLLALGARV